MPSEDAGTTACVCEECGRYNPECERDSHWVDGEWIVEWFCRQCLFERYDPDAI